MDETHRQPVMELASRLRALKLLSGDPSLSNLVKLTERAGTRIPRGTIQEKLSGSSRPTLEQLIILVRACLINADLQKISIAENLRDENHWQQAWYEMKRALSKRQSDEGNQDANFGTGEITAVHQENSATKARVTPPEEEIAEDPTRKLGATVVRLLAEKRERDYSLFEKIRTDPTRESILEALARAVELKIIPSDGCRVRFPFAADIYMRFAPEYHWDMIGFGLETRDTTHLAFAEWDDDLNVADFLVRVAERVQATGRYPGDGRIRPEQLIVDLHTLLTTTYQRSIGKRGTRVPAAVEVIELCPPQWAVTKNGIECLENLHRIVIPNSELGKKDWIDEMEKREWVHLDSFADAFTSAEILDATQVRGQYGMVADEPPF
jgi:hypothetical protein